MAGSEQFALLAALQHSIEHDDAPPHGVEGPLAALWHAGKGNHGDSRKLLEGDLSREAAWVRAHLHRRQGEPGEAAGWYDKAGKDVSTEPVDKELSQIAAALLIKA